jgi:hypothetical protein
MQSANEQRGSKNRVTPNLGKAVGRNN